MIDKIKEMDNVRFWLYAPGEKSVMWNDCQANGLMSIGWDDMGDLTSLESKDDLDAYFDEVYTDADTTGTNSKLCLWEFCNVLKTGDIIYAKKGSLKIIGRGVVESDYIFDDNRNSFKHIRKVKWTHFGEWGAVDCFNQELPRKTLTDMSKYDGWAEKAENTIHSPYTKDEFISEVFMNNEAVEELISLLAQKQNVILQGAPGVGKTFSAKRLAYLMIGEKDDSCIDMVQFHQNYSYEDFIMGFKPTEKGGFELRNGSFYEFCKRAESCPNKSFFFIIDEINRGNLSKIFGELLMLIEKDYRDTAVRLAYSKELFAVPKNLYIIGMMNTADRSLAMIDYALRRRFSFYSMRPGLDTDGFKSEIAKHEDERVARVVDIVRDMNKRIAEDDSLGEGFCIGHSYFCGKSGSNWIENVVKYDLCPMLEEYWFDEREKCNAEKKRLTDALK